MLTLHYSCTVYFPSICLHVYLLLLLFITYLPCSHVLFYLFINATLPLIVIIVSYLLNCQYACVIVLSHTPFCFCRAARTLYILLTPTSPQKTGRTPPPRTQQLLSRKSQSPYMHRFSTQRPSKHEKPQKRREHRSITLTPINFFTFQF